MRYCKCCGSQLDDDAMFCEICGASVGPKPIPPGHATVNNNASRTVKRVTASASSVSSGVVSKIKETGGGSKKYLLIGLIGVVAVAAVVAVILLIGNAARPPIDVEQYVIIEPDGFDGKGVARISVDRSQIEDFLMENYRKLSPMEVEKLTDSIEVDASTVENLSNGQEITFKLKYNTKLVEEKKIKFAKEEWAYKFGATDFKEIKEIDPFADNVVKVEFTGIAPEVQVNIDYRPVNDDIGILPYDSSYNYYDIINIGDTITLTCTADEESLLERGYRLMEKERTYTLEADMVDAYVDSPNMIDEDALATMQKEAEDIVNKAMVDYDEHGEYVLTDPPVFEGVAVLNSKKNTYGSNNIVYLVYSVQCESLRDPNAEDWAEKDAYFEPVKMYIPVEFTGVVKYRDGKIAFNEVNKNLRNSDIGYCYFWGWSYLKGYETADEMFTDIIRKKTDSYNYSLDDNLDQLF